MYIFNDSNIQEKKRERVALEHFMQVKNYSLHISFCMYIFCHHHTHTHLFGQGMTEVYDLYMICRVVAAREIVKSVRNPLLS